MTLDSLWTEDEIEDRDRVSGFAGGVFKHLANILCYAHLLDCSSLVARRLRVILLDHPNVWEACRYYPREIIIIAEEVECAELYDDCLRQVLGFDGLLPRKCPHPTSYEALVVSEEEWKSKYLPKLIQQK